MNTYKIKDAITDSENLVATDIVLPFPLSMISGYGICFNAYKGLTYKLLTLSDCPNNLLMMVTP